MKTIFNNRKTLYSLPNGCVVPRNFVTSFAFRDVNDSSLITENYDGGIFMQSNNNKSFMVARRKFINTDGYDLPVVNVLVHKYNNNSNYLRCNFNFSSVNLLSFKALVCSSRHTNGNIMNGLVCFYTMSLEDGKLIVNYYDGNKIKDIFLGNNEVSSLFTSYDVFGNFYSMLPYSSKKVIFDVSNLNVSDIFNIILCAYKDISFNELFSMMAEKAKSNEKQAPRIKKQAPRISLNDKVYIRTRRRHTVNRIVSRLYQ